MANNDKTFAVILSTAANDRIAEHFEFLARVSEEAADRLLDGLINDIQSLCKMPYRNPVYDRPYVQPLKYRYLISCKRYKIVYQIVDDTVFVDDIQDCRQNEENDLLKS